MGTRLNPQNIYKMINFIDFFLANEELFNLFCKKRAVKETPELIIQNTVHNKSILLKSLKHKYVQPHLIHEIMPVSYYFGGACMAALFNDTRQVDLFLSAFIEQKIFVQSVLPEEIKKLEQLEKEKNFFLKLIYDHYNPQINKTSSDIKNKMKDLINNWGGK
jgi:hypothetical protein